MNKESLEKLEENLKTKAILLENDYKKVKKAKEEWQIEWNKLNGSTQISERLEI